MTNDKVLENDTDDGLFEALAMKQKGWYFIDNEFTDQYGRVVGCMGIAVYHALARRADVKTQKCCPSLDSIASYIATTQKTVIAYIKVLEYLNMIKKIRVGKQCTNRYWLLDKKNWKGDFPGILKDLTDNRDKLIKEKILCAPTIDILRRNLKLR